MADNVDRALGRLEGKVDALAALVENTNTASEKTRVIVTEELHLLSRRTDRHERQIARMEPVVQEVARWRERGIGAIMFIGFVSASFGAAVITLWQKISQLWEG